MKVFVRSPWAYWGDRICIAVLLCGFGGFSIIATSMMIVEGRANLGPLPVFGPLVGSMMILVGIWAFLRPWPTRIEIDATEVRIFHRPTQTVTLARKDVIGAKTVAIPWGGSSVGILYKGSKGETRAVKIYGGWCGDGGTCYVRTSVSKAINSALGL